MVDATNSRSTAADGPAHVQRRTGGALPVMEATLRTSHLATSWPKVLALLKMTPMSKSAATFQPPIGWLNVDASRNMPFILATDDVLQPPMGWSKAAAPENISAMFDTPTTFHLLMSALNLVWLVPGAAHLSLLAKSEAMLLTAAVFQSPMLPYVVLAHASSVTQEVAAVPTLPLVMHVVHTEPIVHVAVSLNVGHTVRKAEVFQLV